VIGSFRRQPHQHLDAASGSASSFNGDKKLLAFCDSYRTPPTAGSSPARGLSQPTCRTALTRTVQQQAPTLAVAMALDQFRKQL